MLGYDHSQKESCLKRKVYPRPSAHLRTKGTADSTDFTDYFVNFVQKAKSTRGHSTKRSFPDTKFTENLPEQLLGINLTGDFSDGVERAPEVD